ncbi:hypothetical protein RND71_008291 [Anisodus tanguticus]|uniref:Uncharacterized protein n=1 Tax=Anisodus tanguticus TaxID=243964 RepID=A0AAE1VKW3_9SOLA|nr:hypothetical protein RND71_008291 [Anisodus tanguticus]
MDIETFTSTVREDIIYFAPEIINMLYETPNVDDNNFQMLLNNNIFEIVATPLCPNGIDWHIDVRGNRVWFASRNLSVPPKEVVPPGLAQQTYGYNFGMNSGISLDPGLENAGYFADSDIDMIFEQLDLKRVVAKVRVEQVILRMLTKFRRTVKATSNSQDANQIQEDSEGNDSADGDEMRLGKDDLVKIIHGWYVYLSKLISAYDD